MNVSEVKARTEARKAAGKIPKAYPVQKGTTRERKTRPPEEAAELPRVALPCLHRGQATGETMPYGGCCGGKANQAPVHACAFFGRCTLHTLFSGVSCCRDCDSREAPG